MMSDTDAGAEEATGTATAPITSAATVVNVLLVDFHHKFGPVVEYSINPIAGETARDGKVKLPDEWKHLPFLALPDGLHNHEEDVTYFTLPALCEASGDDGVKGDDTNADAPGELLQQQQRPRVYGVAVSRQIQTQDLQTSDAHVTRNTVLKAICVISTTPAFTTITNALRPCTSVLFDQRDFTNKAILHDLEASLNRSLASSTIADIVATQDFGLTEWLYRLRYVLMQVYKLMLLQKKILVCDTSGATPASSLSRLALALASLLPGALDGATTQTTTASRAAKAKNQGDNGSHAPPMQAPSSSSSSSSSSSTTRSQLSDEMTALLEASIAAFTHQQEQVWLETGEMQRTMQSPSSTPSSSTPSQQQHGRQGGQVVQAAEGSDDRSGDDEDDVLSSFSSRVRRMNVRLLCPYPGLLRLFPHACLQQADELRGSHFLACPTNMMMVRSDFLHPDVVLDLSKKPTLKFMEPGLKAKASLSTPDLRFIDQLVSSVRKREVGSSGDGESGYAGGDEHIRHSFHTYLLQAAICADTARAHATKANLDRLADFNWDWFAAWRSTVPYARWCHYSDAVLSVYHLRPCDLEASRLHVCAGALQVADVGRRFRQLTTTQLGAERTEAASQRFRATVDQSEKALSEAYEASKKGIASAVSSIRSWWGSVSNQQRPAPSATASSQQQSQTRAKQLSDDASEHGESHA
ncbi:hypothetical protein PTSG_00942 [Salpingoeca rosetta]|uniref:AVL9/DENND6 domain-containing protein n=1 Tax=Salpingoeca rosetta (strain ATCC 50818 / BSB-021) TaxID=946362 RepID=F2TXY2_SALR5|nr:uncharacterized protein PTSG_00942 [Salpingoeca rosetta]EGD76241.1 hypothetical protein PTSG_00942 [Salpingoeca rosetta]|eukprot:XP_004998416.1 hypothetical protein PTSG_00942 [Salpingoeca rosetta]